MLTGVSLILSNTLQKNSDPEQAPPSAANVFLETRKRKPGRKYKTNTDVLERKFVSFI